jgi:hypothetical protein
MLAGEGNCFGAGFRLANHGHVGLPIDNAEQPEAYHRVIVGNQYTNDCGVGSFGFHGCAVRIRTRN